MTDTELSVQPYARDGCAIVVLEGRLSAANYGRLRDSLVKQVMEEPRAVVVELRGLAVESALSLSVFSSVWMRVNDWPGVSLMLAAPGDGLRAQLTSVGIQRYVPVFDDVAAAVGAVGQAPHRLRSETALPSLVESSRFARRRWEELSHRWDLGGLLEDGALLATELVENAIRHAGTEMRLRFEYRESGILTVAVRDGSPRPAVLREAPAERCGYGLHMVSAVAKAWGCAPDVHGGKIVWATIRARAGG